MIQRNLLLMLLLIFSIKAHSQLLTKLCTLDARSSLAIQQVDENWDAVPFDCENISVLIESEDFSHEIKPNSYSFCPSFRYKNNELKDRISGPVFVLHESPGTYQVTISRFQEVSIFNEVVIPLDDSGCHTIQQFIEVNFDMTKQTKKQ